MNGGLLDERAVALADDAAHLLLVDDDRRIRELLSRVLGKNGYRVTLAATAAEARTHLRSFAFDLLDPRRHDAGRDRRRLRGRRAPHARRCRS